MRRPLLAVLTATVMLTLAAAAPAQEAAAPGGLLAFYMQGADLERAGQPEQALAAFRAGLDGYPSSPHLLLRAARAAAAAERPVDCLTALARFAAVGGCAALDQDETLAPLLERPEFQAAAAAVARNGAAPAPAEIVWTLADAELWTEGIACDQATGDLYAGGVKHPRLQRWRDGGETDFGTSAADGLMELLGLDVDEARRQLWAVTGRDAGTPGGKHDFGETPRENALVVYDLDSGARLRTVAMVPDERIHLWNDVSVAPDGTAYLTDMTQGEILRVAPGGAAELFLALKDLNYPNGLAVSEDGGLLYVAGLEGILVVELPGGTAAPLEHAPDLCTGLGDGIAVSGSNLFIVQNSPLLNQRILQLRLDASGRRVTAAAVLPCGLPEGLMPYTCAAGDGVLYVNGTAPFARYDEPAAPPAPVIATVPFGLPPR